MIKLKEKLMALVIFRDILEDKVISKILDLLEIETYNTNVINTIADFESTLFEHETNWTQYLLNTILDSENIYIRNKINNKSNIIIEECLKRELCWLQELGALTLENYLEIMFHQSKNEL